MIIPNDNLPFKLFLFEGGEGKYKRASHWHRSIEIFLVMKAACCIAEKHVCVSCLCCSYCVIDNRGRIRS